MNLPAQLLLTLMMACLLTLAMMAVAVTSDRNRLGLARFLGWIVLLCLIGSTVCVFWWIWS